MFFLVWNESTQDFDLNQDVFTEGIVMNALAKYQDWLDDKQKKQIEKFNDRLVKKGIKIPNGYWAYGQHSANTIVLVDKNDMVWYYTYTTKDMRKMNESIRQYVQRHLDRIITGARL